MPEPPAERSAGPISAGRGSLLLEKVAVVTGATRGIGRAIAVEMAANGADVIALDIVGPVSPASNAAPATPEELDATVRMIKQYGRRSEGIEADSRHRRFTGGRGSCRAGLRQDRHRRCQRGDPALDGGAI
ncbi:SDR family NAD(P)-dependent oxidoreductase [Bradyrhizobium arachidis]|uniref:SDR family NAD(P)-dependent oxidoreductase n=1 Tax=Bradyrhizobium arachidis TaxID=858423 RepID=UPI00142E4CC8|nr:SDR family NAD(P)-dependent oxidoreductase [Bradyrhizobium arachidis]